MEPASVYTCQHDQRETLTYVELGSLQSNGVSSKTGPISNKIFPIVDKASVQQRLQASRAAQGARHTVLRTAGPTGGACARHDHSYTLDQGISRHMRVIVYGNLWDFGIIPLKYPHYPPSKNMYAPGIYIPIYIHIYILNG